MEPLDPTTSTTTTGDPALRAFLADRDEPCPGCGYNLRGVDSGRCPECGRAVRLSIVRPSASPWLVVLMLLWVVVSGTFGAIRAGHRIDLASDPSPFQTLVTAAGNFTVSTSIGGRISTRTITLTPGMPGSGTRMVLSAPGGPPTGRNWGAVSWLDWTEFSVMVLLIACAAAVLARVAIGVRRGRRVDASNQISRRALRVAVAAFASSALVNVLLAGREFAAW